MLSVGIINTSMDATAIIVAIEISVNLLSNVIIYHITIIYVFN